MSNDRFPDFNNPDSTQFGGRSMSDTEFSAANNPGMNHPVASNPVAHNPYDTGRSTVIDAVQQAPEAGNKIQAFIRVLFSFQGRASVGQYWIVNLFSVLVFIAGIGLFAGLSALLDQIDASQLSPIGLILMLIVFILYAWMHWAITIKRFHDRNKSGAWILIGLIPYIGGFWVLIECGFMPGTNGPNRFGAPVQGWLG